MKFKLIPLILLMTACNHTASIPMNTVKITNSAGNSGGSGTIIEHKKSESSILTNAHVCNVVKNGGYVHGAMGSAFVVSYKKSEVHDLCVIKVAKDLGTSADVADDAPRMYDSATVSGHPHLLPNIITKGHFSGKMVITLVTGVKPCNGKEQSPQDVFFCSVLGVKPLIRTLETVVVSATIQPGSSGSAVYDSNGDIAAVIFAGAGDFGYGVAVPHEFIRTFLEQELRVLPKKVPGTEDEESAEPSAQESAKAWESFKRWAKGCTDPTNPNKDKWCDNLKEAQNFSDIIAR